MSSSIEITYKVIYWGPFVLSKVNISSNQNFFILKNITRFTIKSIDRTD